MKKSLSAVVALALAVSMNAQADDKQELVQLRKTISDLVETLVQRKLISKQQGDALLKQTLERAAEAPPAPEPEVEEGAVRVPYVPEIVKEELREQLRGELRQEVADDVLAKARRERWAAPGAWPEWVNRITFSGDLRLRAQQDDFAEGNPPDTYPDFQRINDRRSIAFDNPFLNTTEDRERLRARLRLGANARVSDTLDVSARLATGSLTDPVSTNQTLGNTGRNYQLVLDQAYLRYRSPEEQFTFWGGRMPNPWFGTDLVWDDDLNFEGVAARYRRARSMEVDQPSFNPYVTVGAFPLQEVELSSDDKWLYGVQAGFEWRFARLSVMKLGLSRFDYKNITGRRNAPNDRDLDFTAPQFVQKGNSLFQINNDADPNARLFGLASDFDEINLTTSFDFGMFAPTHVVLTFDYVKNVGFDGKEILNRTGTAVDERTRGHQTTLLVGRSRLLKQGDWQVYGSYKHLERDAVLDAFTDSDFHLGGTDAEGWILGGGYAVRDNAWFNVRYLSSNEIDGIPFGLDTLQFDFNTRF